MTRDGPKRPSTTTANLRKAGFPATYWEAAPGLEAPGLGRQMLACNRITLEGKKKEEFRELLRHLQTPGSSKPPKISHRVLMYYMSIAWWK